MAWSPPKIDVPAQRQGCPACSGRGPGRKGAAGPGPGPADSGHCRLEGRRQGAEWPGWGPRPPGVGSGWQPRWALGPARSERGPRPPGARWQVDASRSPATGPHPGAGGLLPAQDPRAWALTPPWPSGMHKMADAAVSDRGARTWPWPCGAVFTLPSGRPFVARVPSAPEADGNFCGLNTGLRRAGLFGLAALPPHPVPHPRSRPPHRGIHSCLQPRAPSSTPSSGASLAPAGPERGSLGPSPSLEEAAG